MMKRKSLFLKSFLWPLATESGGAMILITVMIGIIALTAFLSFQSYLSNRLESYVKFKEAYKMVNIMEEASKVVRTAWDTSVFKNPPLTPMETIIQQMTQNMPVPAPTCASTCRALNPIESVTMCFNNIDNNKLPYCFYGNAMVPTASLEFNLRDGGGQFDWMQDFLREERAFAARWNQKFWMDMKQVLGLTALPTALAGDYPPGYPSHQQTYRPVSEGPRRHQGANYPPGSMSGPPPFKGPLMVCERAGSTKCKVNTPSVAKVECPPITADMSAGQALNLSRENAKKGCMVCGPKTGKACVLITACPSILPQCRLGPKSAGGKAISLPKLFSQQFILAMPRQKDGAGNWENTY